MKSVLIIQFTFCLHIVTVQAIFDKRTKLAEQMKPKNYFLQAFIRKKKAIVPV